jgi:hypothetical protein
VASGQKARRPRTHEMPRRVGPLDITYAMHQPARWVYFFVHLIFNRERSSTGSNDCFVVLVLVFGWSEAINLLYSGQILLYLVLSI